jgi:hypothetical protein
MLAVVSLGGRGCGGGARLGWRQRSSWVVRSAPVRGVAVRSRAVDLQRKGCQFRRADIRPHAPGSLATIILVSLGPTHSHEPRIPALLRPRLLQQLPSRTSTHATAATARLHAPSITGPRPRSSRGDFATQLHDYRTSDRLTHHDYALRQQHDAPAKAA